MAKNKKREVEINLHVFTNDQSEPGNVPMLQMFYRGAHTNSIGLMRAKNVATGEIESILVGIEPGEGGDAIWPLAKILNPSEGALYRMPDGKGGYLENTETTSES